MSLGRDDILGSRLKRETMKVPEWGGTVIIQEMSGTDRELFEEAVVSMNGDDPVVNKGNLRAQLASFGIVDDAGNRLFTDADSVAELGKTSGSALVRVCGRIQTMNGIGDEEVQDLVEDFGEGPGSDSGTD